MHGAPWTLCHHCATNRIPSFTKAHAMRPTLCAGLAALCLVAAQPVVAASSATPPQISAAHFARYDRTLASDAFGGRKPGTPGGERTVAWLVEQFKRMGLEPGNHGSWFQ